LETQFEVLADITARFESIGIDFMVTGSVALGFYTEFRLTRDLDVVIELPLKSLKAFISVLGQDYYVSPEAALDAVQRGSMFNIIHQELVFKVDCIIRKESAYSRTAFSRRKKLTLRNVTCWVASLEDLVISKMLWAFESRSEMQFRDIQGLLKSPCDLLYIDQWAQELKIESLWKEFRP
jgi:hypothetical protein